MRGAAQTGGERLEVRQFSADGIVETSLPIVADTGPDTGGVRRRCVGRSLQPFVESIGRQGDMAAVRSANLHHVKMRRNRIVHAVEAGPGRVDGLTWLEHGRVDR